MEFAQNGTYDWFEIFNQISKPLCKSKIEKFDPDIIDKYFPLQF